MSISRSQRTAPSQVAANKLAAGGGASGLWFDHARYDGENKLKGAEVRLTPTATMVTEYGYDGEGRRVLRREGGVVKTVFVYDAKGEMVAEYGEGAAMPCTTCYVTADHLGSTRVVWGTDGKMKKLYDYAPFGEEVGANYRGGDTRYPVLVYPRAGWQGVSMEFTGKERDGETGLDYFGARYMSAAQGRFTSPDPPLLAQEPSEPQSWNLYSYTANNPLTRIDPDGHNRFNVNGRWEWHECDTYDPEGAKGKQKPIKSNYTHLLVFQQTGTNRYGAATGTLTLYDQNKVIATSTGFSGGSDSPAKSEPIPGGTFYINLERKETATSPGAVRNVDGGAQLHNHYGIEKIQSTLSDAAANAYDFRVEWGNIRAALNEPRPGMPQAYRGNFLHGKTRTGDYTHGCICERSERILNMLWTLPTPRVPVWVRRP